MSASSLLPPLPTPIDLPRSRELARRLGTGNGDCYRNAAAALLRTPALQVQGVRYVEGLVVSHGALVMPVEHGWLELPDDGRGKLRGSRPPWRPARRQTRLPAPVATRS